MMICYCYKYTYNKYDDPDINRFATITILELEVSLNPTKTSQEGALMEEKVALGNIKHNEYDVDVMLNNSLENADIASDILTISRNNAISERSSGIDIKSQIDELVPIVSDAINEEINYPTTLTSHDPEYERKAKSIVRIILSPILPILIARTATDNKIDIERKKDEVGNFEEQIRHGFMTKLLIHYIAKYLESSTPDELKLRRANVLFIFLNHTLVRALIDMYVLPTHPLEQIVNAALDKHAPDVTATQSYIMTRQSLMKPLQECTIGDVFLFICLPMLLVILLPILYVIIRG